MVIKWDHPLLIDKCSTAQTFLILILVLLRKRNLMMQAPCVAVSLIRKSRSLSFLNQVDHKELRDDALQAMHEELQHA